MNATTKPTADKTAARTSPFWQFSIKFYAMPGVAPACITLQDDAGVDVNFLFFLLWNATQCRTLSEPEVRELDKTIGAWRDIAVIPLRELRRKLKSSPTPLAPDAAEAFRTRIKQVELEAERLQQEAMYALAQSGRFNRTAPSPIEAARASIAAYQVLLRPLPREPLEVVLSAFAQTLANG
jgi:uncharacterized protein (TIGR02444 family)